MFWRSDFLFVKTNLTVNMIKILKSNTFCCPNKSTKWIGTRYVKSVKSKVTTFEYILYQIVLINIPTGGDYDDDVESGVEVVEWGYLAVVGAAGSLEYIATDVAAAAVGTDDD